MKLKQNYSSAILLVWALQNVLANIACADTTYTNIKFLLEGNNHPYFLKPYSNKDHETLKELYHLNHNQLLWFSTEHPVQTIDQLLEHYKNAEKQGLNSEDYATQHLTIQWQKIQQSNPDFLEFAIFDTALSLTFLRYLSDLHYGRLRPEQFGFDLPEKNRLDFASHIYGAIQINTINALVESMEPIHLHYQQLKNTLAKYRRLNQYFDQAVYFNFKQTLHPGDWSTQVSDLEHYLDALNTPVNQAIVTKTRTSNYYTPRIVEKIRNLQVNHNLDNDGIIGKQTLAVLNTPISKRIAQIELAMERLRWLPERQQGPFILVNIPAFQLWAYNAEQTNSASLNMKVVVGKAINDRKDLNKESEGQEKLLQTPIFTANLSYLVFSPYWNIPKSILTKEILPLVEQNPDYLLDNKMEIVNNFSHNATVLPINQENISRLHTGQLHLRQRPGPGNALGHIKFIFPNNHKVYLHDTPAISLFKRNQRDFSHGCIRVENPNKLALFALKKQPEWDAIKIKQAMHADEPQIVDLKQAIPVLIFYSTASVTKTGDSFYPDIYDHDRILQLALTERSQNLIINTLATKF